MPTRKGQRYRVEARQERAQERQEYWASLSPEDQLSALDERLGPGMGANRQRARLRKAIEKRGNEAS